MNFARVHRAAPATEDPTGDDTDSKGPLAHCVMRFSLNGRDLVVVQDGEAGEEGGCALPNRSMLVAGWLSIGSDTYTIFLLGSAQAQDGDPCPRRPIDLLTQRELQIAAMVMQGSASKQIARRLYIAPNTVQSHLKRIFCKLGVSSRAAMVAQLAGCLGASSGR